MNGVRQMFSRMKYYICAIVCGLGGLMALALFSAPRNGSIAELPQVTRHPIAVRQGAVHLRQPPSTARTPSPLALLQSPDSRTEPDRRTLLEQTLQSEDETALDAVSAQIDGNSFWLERVAAFLEDPGQSTEERVTLGKELMKSGTQAETLLLINAILHAFITGDSDVADGLIQALADAQTPESAVALTRVITEGSTDLPFQQMPEGLKYAIQKAIRLNPDAEATALALATTYNSQVSSEVVGDLEDVRHPLMLSILAEEAYQSGDSARAGDFVRKLTTIDDPRTLDCLMKLGESSLLPQDEANGKAYAWVSEHSDIFDQDRYAAYLSDFNANVAQRAVASFALAAAPDADSALAALGKAIFHESDPLVLSYLESAKAMLLDRSQKP